MFSLLDDTTRIYILCGYTDFRKGMDSLTQMAVEHGVEILLTVRIQGHPPLMPCHALP